MGSELPHEHDATMQRDMEPGARDLGCRCGRLLRLDGSSPRRDTDGNVLKGRLSLDPTDDGRFILIALDGETRNWRQAGR